MAHGRVGLSRRLCDVRDMSAWGLIPEMPVSDFAVAQTVLTSGASPAAFWVLPLRDTLPPCQFFQPRDHRRIRIGQRRNRSEVVGAGDRTEPGREAGRAPAVDDGPALPKIFRAFVFAHDSIETSARRSLPEQRARSNSRSAIEPQGLVDRRFDHRLKFEQT